METQTQLLTPTSYWNADNTDTSITMEDYLGSNFSFVLIPTHGAVSCICNLYVNHNQEEIPLVTCALVFRENQAQILARKKEEVFRW